MRKTRILKDAGATLADHARDLLGGGKPGLGGWLKTGAALGAARTGARVATRFAKRNPGIAVAAAVVGLGVIAYGAYRKRANEIAARDAAAPTPQDADVIEATEVKATRRAQA